MRILSRSFLAARGEAPMRKRFSVRTREKMWIRVSCKLLRLSFILGAFPSIYRYIDHHNDHHEDKDDEDFHYLHHYHHYRNYHPPNSLILPLLIPPLNPPLLVPTPSPLPLYIIISN